MENEMKNTVNELKLMQFVVNNKTITLSEVKGHFSNNYLFVDGISDEHAGISRSFSIAFRTEYDTELESGVFNLVPFESIPTKPNQGSAFYVLRDNWVDIISVGNSLSGSATLQFNEDRTWVTGTFNSTIELAFSDSKKQFEVAQGIFSIPVDSSLQKIPTHLSQIIKK